MTEAKKKQTRLFYFINRLQGGQNTMKRISAIAVIMAIVFIVTGVIVAPAAHALDYGMTVKNSGDPCQNPNVSKSSALISVASNTSQATVAAATGKKIYVCNVNAYLTGTTTLTTLELVSGATTTLPCDTGAASLSGVHGVTSAVGLEVHMGFGGTLFTSPTTTANLCTKTTGTSSAVTGAVTYVQQ